MQAKGKPDPREEASVTVTELVALLAVRTGNLSNNRSARLSEIKSYGKAKGLDRKIVKHVKALAKSYKDVSAAAKEADDAADALISARPKAAKSGDYAPFVAEMDKLTPLLDTVMKHLGTFAVLYSQIPSLPPQQGERGEAKTPMARGWAMVEGCFLNGKDFFGYYKRYAQEQRKAARVLAAKT